MTPEDEVRVAFNALRKALMTCNAAGLEELYHDDYRGFNIRGGVDGRELVLQTFKPGGVKLEKYDVKEMDIKVINNVGMVTGRGYISGSYGDHKFEHHVRFLDIFIREAPNWYYYMSQATEIKNP